MEHIWPFVIDPTLGCTDKKIEKLGLSIKSWPEETDFSLCLHEMFGRDIGVT